MRMHIELDDGLVARIDQRAGARNRSSFVRRAIEAALDEHQRWDLILSASGSIAAEGHDWDDDPEAWVRRQRFSDSRRVG